MQLVASTNMKESADDLTPDQKSNAEITFQQAAKIVEKQDSASAKGNKSKLTPEQQALADLESQVMTLEDYMSRPEIIEAEGNAGAAAADVWTRLYLATKVLKDAGPSEARIRRVFMLDALRSARQFVREFPPKGKNPDDLSFMANLNKTVDAYEAEAVKDNSQMYKTIRDFYKSQIIARTGNADGLSNELDLLFQQGNFTDAMGVFSTVYFNNYLRENGDPRIQALAQPVDRLLGSSKLFQKNRKLIEHLVKHPSVMRIISEATFGNKGQQMEMLKDIYAEHYPLFSRVEKQGWFEKYKGLMKTGSLMFLITIIPILPQLMGQQQAEEEFAQPKQQQMA